MEHRHHRWLWLLASALVAAVVPGSGDGRVDRGAAPSTTTSPAPTSTTDLAPTTPRPTTTTSTITPTTATIPPPPAVSTTAPQTTVPTWRVVDRGDPTRRLVALTFDAGSDTGYTAEVLGVLAREGIRATFGLTGRWAEQNPGLARRIAAGGHQLVNHSYDHPSFTGRSTGSAPLSAAERTGQLLRAEEAIRVATSQATAPWWRPPYGDIDSGVLASAAAAGWPVALMWTVDSLGWKGVGLEAVVARCLGAAEPGAIILLHVGAASDDAAALPDLIAGLRARGYGFATAAEIAG